MKREDLEKLGLTDKAVIDAVMELHGKDIETHKSQVSTAKQQIDTLTAQLGEASKQIEGFKSLDIEGVKKAADEWKQKAEQAQQDAAAQLAQVKFEHALDTALAGAKVKNAATIKPLLSMDSLRDAKGELLPDRLTEQLTKIKSDNDFLFAEEKPAPKIVTGGNNKSVLGDPVIDAARRAAGLSTE